MGDSAGRGGGLDLVVLLEALQSVPEAYVLAVRGLAGRLERLGRRSVDEVERRAALQLDRRERVMGEDEGRCVERRVGTPPALPLRVLVPSGRAELPGTHDLGADPGVVQPREGVVEAAVAAGLADHLAPPPGREHPFVQSFAGVAERSLVALRFAAAEA